MSEDGTMEPLPRIAIVGLAGRFPGCRSLDELWRNLRDGVECITSFSDEELLAAGVAPATLADPAYVKAGALLEDIDLFDAAFFGFSPREAEITDPQQRIFLECAWEALESAGYDPERYPGAVGVYAGTGMSRYLPSLYAHPELVRAVGSYRLHLGNDKDFLATLVSYKLNLRGPSLSVQTACSTSLVAVHLAVQSLLNGECDMALAGGVSITVLRKSGYFYREGGISSPDGHCRAFDAAARGTVGGNGAGVVVLKRLADALADGDTIRAVILGSAVNNDGSLKVGFTAPGLDGQARVIREALAVASVDPRTITYVEAHGTGTSLGDPIEVAALNQAFGGAAGGRDACALGSVKTNLGHLDIAAGVAGLVKTVLALEHGELPPSLHFERPSPEIDFAGGPFRVNAALVPWQASGSPRRAGVSAFGIGGTNAHVILEEAPARTPPNPALPWHLLLLSAESEPALERATAALAEHLRRHPELELADIAFTLQAGRRHCRHRRALVCGSREEALAALSAPRASRVLTRASGERRAVAFLFPGQGSQHPGMAEEVYRHEPRFREELDRCCDLLAPLLGIDLRGLIYPVTGKRDEARDALRRTGLAQPALFAVEYALARLWMAWGLQPGALLGHSLGEYVAACLAGVFSLADALKLVAARGRLMQSVEEGAMLAVPLGEDEVLPLLGAGLSLAAVNGPARSVVSGRAEPVLALERHLSAQGVACRRLDTASAFHSELMEPVAQKLVAEVSRVALRPPTLRFLSNVTGRWITAEEATDPQYWGRQMRQTVRFSDGLTTLVREGFVLLEVGPDQVLTSLARGSRAGGDRIAVPSLPSATSDEPAIRTLLAALGELHASGAEVDWLGLHGGARRLRVPLPTYPFERRRYWIESQGGTSKQREKMLMPEPQTTLETASPRRQEILESLRSIVVSLTGLEREAIDEHVQFLEAGIDSLLLIQAIQLIQERCGVKVSIVQLLEDLSSLDALARHIDRELPPAAPASAAVPAPAVPAAVPPPALAAPPPVAAAPVAPVEAGGDTTLIERVLAQQMRIMSEQLQLLRGLPGPAPIASEPLPPPRMASAAGPAVQPAPPPAGPEGIEPEMFVPYQPIRSDIGELTDRQRRYLDAFVARYTARTRESRRLSELYRPVYADGRVTARFRRLWKDLIYPITGVRSAGSRVWDVDGNEYIDVAMGYGVHLFGHSPGFLVEALEEQLHRGIELAPRCHLAGEAAELVCELTGLERAAFCNSGTEAVMAALRAARTVTRREKVAYFAGSYHGWSDLTLGRTFTAEGPPVPVAPGVSSAAVGDALVLSYDHPESLEILRARCHELAAVLVEPVQSRRPDIQPAGFLHELRAITEAAGAVLIFDEMVTGFRVHPGGVQARFGIRADLATYGKVVAGGMPIGVVAGRAPFMDVLDGGGDWRFGDDSYPMAVKTMFGGAFFANPLTMAATCAVLKRLKREGPALQERINGLTADLAGRLNAVLVEEELPLRVAHFGSLFRFLHPGRLKHSDLLFHHLIAKGLYYAPEVGNCFLSTAHGEEDVDAIERAVVESIDELRHGGFLPERPGGAPRARPVTMAAAPATHSAQPRPGAAAMPTPAVELSLYYFGPYEAEYRRDKYDLLYEGVRFGDQRGFSAVWLPERHFHTFGGFSPNPSILAAALARETERIEIRAGSVVLPLHHPIRVAEEWALVDNLSNGRVGVSFASGWHPNDFAFAPEAYAGRHDIMLRGIETVRRLWRGESIEVRSGTGQPLSVRLFPLPKQGDLPIWLTGTSSETYRRAGRLGAGIVTNLQDQTIDEVAEKVRLYHEALAEAGHHRSRARMTVLLHTFLGADARAAREQARRPFCSYLRANLGLLRNRLANENRQVDLERLAPADMDYLLNSSYEFWVASSTLIGSPQSAAEVIERLSRIGVTEIGCLIDFGIDRDRVLESLHHLDLLRQRFSGPWPSADEPMPAAPPLAPAVVSSPAGVPLTEAQKALWFLTRMSPDASRAYNESITLGLRGTLRVDALAGALQTVVTRHEGLRARFTPDGELQWTVPEETLALPLVDLTALPEPHRERQAESLTLAWAQEPLDLERGPLLRSALLRLAATQHRLVVTTHHLVVDGHATSVILRELAALYTAACRGESPALPAPVRLSEFVRRSGTGDGVSAAADEEYWAERFADPVPVLDLPLDRPRPAVKRYGVARHRRFLDGELTAALRTFSRRQGSTLFMTMLAGFQALLCQLTGQRDLVVGINAAPPLAEADRTLVGFRVNALPLRSRIEEGETVAAYLTRLKRVVAEGYEHQSFSPHRLLRRLKLRRDPSRPGLVSVVFDLERSGKTPEFTGLEVETGANPVGAKVDLYVNVTESARGIEARCDFDSNLFTPATIVRWLEHYEVLLRTIASAPDRPVDDLPRLPPSAEPAVAATPEVVSNLSRYQLLLWMSQKLDPEAPLLANPGTLRLRAPIIPEILEQAFQSVLDGSDALRTIVEEIQGVPFQRVQEGFRCAIDYRDLSASSEPAAEARALARERCRVPHVLSRSLIDVALFKLGEADFLWHLNINHLIADIWAVTVVLHAIFGTYEALLAGQPSPFLPLPPFADSLKRERELLASGAARLAEEHWREKLSRGGEEMSFYGIAAARRSGRIERLTLDLGAERNARLKEIAAGEPFNILGALVCAYLARISGNRMLTLGVPFHNRTSETAKRMVGLLMQILPLQVTCDDGETFASLAKRWRSSTWESLRYRSFPVGNPLGKRAYEVEVNYAPMSLFSFGGAPVEYEWFHPGYGSDSLAVQILDLLDTGRLLVQLDFHCDVFNPRQQQLAAGHFVQVIDAFLEDPGRQVGSFSLLAEEERREVLFGFNASAREFPVGQILSEAFEAQVVRDPGRIAVVDDDGAFTYAELHDSVCRLALRLEAAGVGLESVVAVLSRRNRAFLVAILAIFRAGGAYLPLDPGSPANRLRQVLGQSRVTVALVEPELQPELLRALGEIPAGELPLVLDLTDAGRGSSAAARPALPGLTSRLAYVIYTSGSTGVPKGALVEQAGMMNHLHAKIADLGLASDDVVAQTASQAFDISVWQFLAPLLVGGRARIYSDETVRDPTLLLRCLEADGVSIFETVPSLLRAMVDDVDAREDRPGLRALRWLLTTGEALPADLCRRWLSLYPSVPLVNAYGPTECSDDVTHHFLDQAPKGSVPIGTPIANLRAYVVDSEFFPVPAGVASELWIGGAGVGRGYLRDAARTAQAFVPDPFSGEPGARLYRTGDLCRFRLDGCLEFLGRIDNQVKIRGQRIELGEIETVLRGHPAVQEAVVLARKDTPDEHYLAAYLVPRADAEPKPGELRAYLRERLPEAMVPAAFVGLAALPLTPNGKIDRAALPAPQGGREALEQEIVVPRNPRESALAAIWQEVLGLAEVGVHDNFFELGGDSILSIQIASRASRAGLRFNPVQVFEHPTIARLAAAEMGPDHRGEQEIVTGPVPLTPIQYRFFDLDVPNRHHWNQAILLEVARPLKMPRLATALSRLLEHHDALRHRFRQRAAGWVQVAEPPAGEVPLSSLDLSALPESVMSRAVESAASALQGSLHLTAGPLLRLAWLDLGTGRPGRLLLIAHHLVVDGVSWRVLLEDLDSAYRQLERGGPVELPPKTTSFKRWAERLNDHARSPVLQKELAYWLDERRSPVPALPLDFPQGANTRASARGVSVTLDAEETQALLRELPATFHSQINDVLLATLADVIAGWTGGGPMLVDLEGHGREEIAGEIDLSRTVGWFTSLFPVLLEADPAEPPERRIERIGAQLRAVPGNGVGYGALRYCGAPEVAARLRALPPAEVSFNYLGRLDQALPEGAPFRMARESAGPAAARGGLRSHLLEINGLIAGGRLRLDWAYSASLHRAATIEALASGHANALRELISRSRGGPVQAVTDVSAFKWSRQQLDGIAAALNLPRGKQRSSLEP